jgi:hypothetical protein
MSHVVEMLLLHTDGKDDAQVYGEAATPVSLAVHAARSEVT